MEREIRGCVRAKRTFGKRIKCGITLEDNGTKGVELFMCIGSVVYFVGKKEIFGTKGVKERRVRREGGLE